MNELKQDMQELVDLMTQKDAFNDAILEKRKEIKATHELPIPTINRIATILRKDSLEEEDTKWAELKNLIIECK